MKILILGHRGMLGKDLCTLLSKDFDVIGYDQDTLDVTNISDLESKMEVSGADVLINCTVASSNPDVSEIETEKAFLVNCEAVKNMAHLAAGLNMKFIHYSTDYVFDGKKQDPYCEEDVTNPLSVYGASKEKGEQAIQDICDDYLILRTSWLFGVHGETFITKILKAADERPQLTVVDDQRGAPTYTQDLAFATKVLIEKDAKGIFHVTNSGYCSWYEFAKRIIEVQKKDVPVKPISSEELIRKAQRPNNSCLSIDKLTQFSEYQMPTWQDALTRYFDELNVIK